MRNGDLGVMRVRVTLFDSAPSFHGAPESRAKLGNVADLELVPLKQWGTTCGAVAARAAQCLLSGGNPADLPPLTPDDWERWKTTFSFSEEDRVRDAATTFHLADWTKLSHGGQQSAVTEIRSLTKVT